MRILHVSHELPPHELAGTAIYTLNIARAQAREHDVFVFARLQDPKLEPYRIHTEVRDGLTIRFMNLADLRWSPFEDSYRDARAERLFRDFVDEVQPEIVHFQHVVGLGMGVLDVPRELGIRALYTLHDFWPMCPMGQRMCYTDNALCDPIDFKKCGPCVFGSGWKEGGAPGGGATNGATAEGGLRGRWSHLYRQRYLETPGRFARRPRAMLWAARRALGEGGRAASPSGEEMLHPFERRFHRLRRKLEQMDLCITPSAFLRDEFIRHFGLSPAQVIHSANGMDFSYVKPQPKRPSSRLRVGFTGSIIPTKGVRVLVDGFLEAAALHENLELHVHGAPNRWTQGYLDELKATARAHPAGTRAFFHGRFDNQRIGEVHAGIDVLVLPSIWFENAPLTLNEAAMTGTPVIVSDRGGMLEFVTANRYGRTFSLGDSHALAAVLGELAADPSLVHELAGNPPPIKSVTQNAEELASIYEQLLAGRFRAPSIEAQTASRGGILVGGR